jgi:hypothetical protein
VTKLRSTKLAALARWLHLYLSLFGFATILFFAVTGLTLNHAAWFESGGESERVLELEVPRELIELPAESALVAWLRSSAGVHGDVYDYSADEQSVSIALKGPGYAVDAEFDVPRARASVRERQLNSWAFLDDLHKGRDSGAVWSWVIDISAVLMALSAATGLWLLLYIQRRRNPGLVVTLVGTLVLVAVGWWFTP